MRNMHKLYWEIFFARNVYLDFKDYRAVHLGKKNDAAFNARIALVTKHQKTIPVMTEFYNRVESEFYDLTPQQYKFIRGESDTPYEVKAEPPEASNSESLQGNDYEAPVIDDLQVSVLAILKAMDDKLETLIKLFEILVK